MPAVRCASPRQDLVTGAREADGVQDVRVQVKGVVIAKLPEHGPAGLQAAPLDEQRQQKQEAGQG